MKRIFQGLDLPSLLGTDYKPTTGGSYTSSSTPEQFQFNQDDFLDWANNEYKQYNGTKRKIKLKASNYIKNQIKKGTGVSDENIANGIALYLQDGLYDRFFSNGANKNLQDGAQQMLWGDLEVLRENNSPYLKALDDNGTYMFDPEGAFGLTSNRGTTYVWDSKTN